MKHSSNLLLFWLVFFFIDNIYAQHLTRFLDELPIKTFSDGIQSVVANVNQKGNPISKAVQTGEHGPRPSQQVHKNEKDYNRQLAKKVLPPDVSED